MKYMHEKLKIIITIHKPILILMALILTISTSACLSENSPAQTQETGEHSEVTTSDKNQSSHESENVQTSDEDADNSASSESRHELDDNSQDNQEDSDLNDRADQTDHKSTIETTNSSDQDNLDETKPSGETEETTQPKATEKKTEATIETTTKVTTESEPHSQNVTLKIDASIAAEAGLAGVPENGIILNETIIEIEDEETVADLLARAGRELGITVAIRGSGRASFVTSIAGISGVDAKSGWMFSVDGVYVMTGSGSYKLSPGEKIVWYYTMDSGSDLP